MNLFFLHLSPILAAQDQCDKHVVKMILETAQLLSTCVSIIKVDIDVTDKIYKPTHVNHPCTIWVRTSSKNFEWAITHALALCEEYTRRYKKTHKSKAIILFIQELYITNQLKFDSEAFTDPPKCMPDQYRISESVVECYREFYIRDKSRFAVWKYTPTPKWFHCLQHQVSI